MKTRLLFFLAGLLPLMLLRAQSSVPVIQPTIMVIPYAEADEQLRSALETDDALRIAVTKVKEGFDDRGYSTVDFRARLNQLGNDRVMELDNATSLKQEVIELSGADIYVEVEVQRNRTTAGNSVNVVMTAYDVFSSRSLANKVASSPKFYSEDFGKLTERALGNSVEELLNTMQLKFDDIVRNGRILTMNIGFAVDSALDMDAEIGDGMDLLSDVIEDWLQANAYQSYYHLQGITATKMLVDEIRVPFRDEEGRNFRTSRFVNGLRKYLADLGIESSRDIQGSRVFLTIH
jgi:hypothetical protein